MNALQTGFNDRLRPLQTWFAGLQPREQVIVRWGAIALPMLVLAAAILMVHGAVSEASARVEKKQEDLAWMRTVAGELRAAGPAAVGDPAAPSSGTLIMIVDRSAQQTGLGSSLTGSQPSGNGGLRVTMENAPFDTLVAWFAMLERQHQVATEVAEVKRTGKPGIVNATVVLRKAG
jgi:general secretion pathway protein M